MKNLLPTCGLLLATLLFSQCDRPEEPIPPTNLLPREQIVRMLVDLHLTEARVEGAGLPPDSARALYKQQAKAMYRRHQTDDATFQQSLKYYAIHGKDLEEIYATVVDSLGARETKLTGAKPAERPAGR